MAMIPGPTPGDVRAAQTPAAGERTWSRVSLVVLALLSAQLLSLMNAGAGRVGHDYVWFLPRLVEGIAFFRAQGFAAPLYSSFFCGGFPYHADPQVMFYSLPQLLALLVGPWESVQITAVFFLVAGGLAAYQCGRLLFRLDPPACALLAATFAANGFFRARLLIGHLTYQAYPLIPVLLLATFHRGLSRLNAVLISTLVFATIVQSGGNYTALIVIGATVVSIPLLRLRAALAYREAAIRTGLALLLALALCASKLSAGLAFSGQHPRIARFIHLDDLSEAADLVYFQLFAPGKSFAPFPFKAWEYDCSISPVVSIGWALALWSVLRSRNKHGLVSMGAFLLLSLATVQFATGAAGWVDVVKAWPIFEQMRINVRFTAILIFPLLAFAAVGFDSLRHKGVVVLVVLASTFVQGERLRERAPSAWMDISPSKLSSLAQRVRTSGLAIEGISVAANDLDPLLEGRSNKNCYSVFFDAPPDLQEGSVWDARGGSFNFIKPACYVHPAENRCRGGDRIPISERGALAALLRHEDPGWAISSTQRVANHVSTTAVLAYAVFAAIAVGRGLLRRSARTAAGGRP